MACSLIRSFVSEAQSGLIHIDGLLRCMERGVGMAGNDDVNECYRAIHTISGLASFLGLNRIAALAKAAEQLLEEMWVDRLHRSALRIDALLRAVKRLGELVECVIQDESHLADDGDIINELQALIIGTAPTPRVLHPIQDSVAARRRLWHANQVPTGPRHHSATTLVDVP